MSRYSQAYENIDFKDKKTVKNLLDQRAYFESTRFISDGSMFNKTGASHDMYIDLINIYADLDNLIAECDLSERNKKLLKLVESGYTVNYIYNNLDEYEKWSTLRMYDRIVEKINQKQESKEVERNENPTTQRRREKT